MDNSTGAYSPRQQMRDLKREKEKPIHPICIAIMAVVPKDATVLDMGASIGTTVCVLKKHGFKIQGIDATKGIEKITQGLVTQKDLIGDCSDLYGSVDWGLFLEVGEHIPKQFESQLIDNVSKIPTKGLIVSWASPQYDWFRGHVNCQEESYVINEFQKRGWNVNNELTDTNRSLYNSVKRKMTVFVKEHTG